MWYGLFLGSVKQFFEYKLFKSKMLYSEREITKNRNKRVNFRSPDHYRASEQRLMNVTRFGYTLHIEISTTRLL